MFFIIYITSFYISAIIVIMFFISEKNKLSFLYNVYYVFARVLGKNKVSSAESAREKVIIKIGSIVDKKAQVLIKNICSNC